MDKWEFYQDPSNQWRRQTTLMNCTTLRFTRYAPTLLSWFTTRTNLP